MDSKVHSVEGLMQGATSMACCRHIHTVAPIYRHIALSRLAYERLERKAKDTMRSFKECNESWNETFHTILLGVIGGISNRAPMLRLARRVTNNMLMRENSSIVNLEAMLLGGSGLLDLYGDDDYLRLLRQEFGHLSTKYGIKPMSPGEWHLMGIYPHNHPTLRLTQLASCILNSDFTMHSALRCKTQKDVYNYFCGTTSDYWLENFIPSNNHLVTNYRMGHLKSDLLGINLIAPMMYTYGIYTHTDAYLNQAVELQESITGENNKYTKPWIEAGFELHNAFESQALIQLTKEYCSKRRCRECHLARYLVK